MPLPDGSRRVAILLSTYNGARFLREQLASFLAQTHPDWVLHWRDDGSCDDSVTLMRTFAAVAGQGRSVEHAGAAGNVGVLASYLGLLREVAPTLGETDAVSFADQDDVWLPEKLARGLAMLPAATAPALYCARYLRTDAALRTLGESERLRRPAGFPQALTQNVATGCTMLLNRAAARLAAASAPPPATLHDWWCYLVVSAAGGAVLRDEMPVVLYRQHGRNTVGAAPDWSTRARGALRRGPVMFMGLLRAHVAALLAGGDELDPTARRQLVSFDRALRAGRLSRVSALLLTGLRRQGFWETWAFRAWFLLG